MPEGLTREKLVRTALRIVDEDGLEALSMRRLGTELDVDPMAAYRHLPNKDALLDGLVEAIVLETDLEVDPSLPWRDRLTALVRSNLDALLAHPNALPLVVERPLVTPAGLRIVEVSLAITTEAGIPLHDALLAVNSMGRVLVALAVTVAHARADVRTPEERRADYARLPITEFPHMAQAIATGQVIGGPEEILDFWLESLLDRLERAATREARPFS